MRRSLILIPLVLIALVPRVVWGWPLDTGGPVQAPDPAAIQVGLEPVVGGLQNVVAVANAGDGTGRLFVIEKVGRVRIVRDGAVEPEPFLDITDRVNAGANERGLLGIAFHPDYTNNGFFFVNYTRADGASVNARFQVTGEPDRADPASEKEIITYEQPRSNHNGGHLLFGPDGYLYIGTGDGGAGGDPWGNGQDRLTFLGKMLRLDVDGGDPYAIPPDNPFIALSSARGEIWAYGLRNPWRYSFDRATGDLYIGDVGQQAWEEVHFQPADSPGGENYGWNIMEGTHCYNAPSCDQTGLVLPVAEYPHQGGDCSITGGYVYRGTLFPGLVGAYFYADWCTGNIWALVRDAGGAWRSDRVGRAGFDVATFGEGEDGEIYLAGGGQVARLVDANAGQPSPTPTDPPPTATVPPPTATVPLPTVTPIPVTGTPEPTGTPMGEWVVLLPYSVRP